MSILENKIENTPQYFNLKRPFFKKKGAIFN